MTPLKSVFAFAVTVALAAGPNPAAADPSFWSAEWPRTDFETTSVESWLEILSGGPPKDGIPAIDGPDFHAVREERELGPKEPVIALEIAGQVPRAYPLRYLLWHEIINDTVGATPVAVTFCPLCNSGIVFDRRLGAQVLSFGVTGKLRNSDMIMYDRETESWWQQATGEAIVGELTGAGLLTLPAWMESWEIFAARNPAGLVMSRPEGSRRPYGRNPYVQYDSSVRPFLFNGELPPHGVPALARVVRVGDRAWPLQRLSEAGSLTEDGLTLSWEAGQASALDTSDIAMGRDVGNVRVRDASGADLAHDVMFAFAFHAFWPEGRWMLGD